jgi:hypothetical protein
MNTSPESNEYSVKSDEKFCTAAVAKLTPSIGDVKRKPQHLVFVLIPGTFRVNKGICLWKAFLPAPTGSFLCTLFNFFLLQARDVSPLPFVVK